MKMKTLISIEVNGEAGRQTKKKKPNKIQRFNILYVLQARLCMTIHRYLCLNEFRRRFSDELE